MASTNSSSVREIRSTVRRYADRIGELLEPVLTPLKRFAAYAFGSFFRFMILFGVVLLVLGATLFDGTVAGHLGIYGITSVVIGAIGRLIIRWKTRETSAVE